MEHFPPYKCQHCKFEGFWLDKTHTVCLCTPHADSRASIHAITPDTTNIEEHVAPIATKQKGSAIVPPSAIKSAPTPATDFVLTTAIDYAPPLATIIDPALASLPAIGTGTLAMPVTPITPLAVVREGSTVPFSSTQPKTIMKRSKLTKSGVPRKIRKRMQSHLKLAILVWLDQNPTATQRETGERFGFSRSTIGKDVPKWCEELGWHTTLGHDVPNWRKAPGKPR
ncbi:uncharacterized protein V1518DRAFT_142895 [Limtongia smithiae]|uniref:uncharacterized protein n=1 Tax=Limtongia smithiae TaxID=1125753 RepID=UPI0034CD287F